MVNSPPDIKIPAHVAIIMDGNGRWAKKRLRPRLFGHKAGMESVRAVVTAARETGVEVLTLYAFSTENWQRSSVEVNGLMKLMHSFLESELDEMLENDIRLFSIGQKERLPGSVRQKLEYAIDKTSSCSGMILNLALSYGSRSEIVRAVRNIAIDCLAGSIKPDDIDEKTVNDYLYTSSLPDPDLLIRTGGEQRLSNFLLWQLSYSELYFTDVPWPDFRKSEFMEALNHYSRRQRRFGCIAAEES